MARNEQDGIWELGRLAILPEHNGKNYTSWFLARAIKQFIEISNRQSSFSNMTTDEKLAEIANLIENMLKKDGKFISIDYSLVCFDYIDEEMVKQYRHKLHCFRHSSDESIAERVSYSNEQKSFLIDYGLVIIKAIHDVLEIK